MDSSDLAFSIMVVMFFAWLIADKYIEHRWPKQDGDE